MGSSAFKKVFSPRSLSGSLIAAAVIHASLYAGVVMILGTDFLKSERPEIDAEIGYEILDAPPVPTEKVARVMQKVEPEKIVQPEAKVDTAARELQDEKSDIVGTQQSSMQKSAAAGSESGGDANATPFYKIKPKYPRAALVAGEEGWILMKIDVNEAGVVENVRVIGGEKRNLFQDEARRAVEQWKYRPFVDGGGHAFKKTDHQVRVDFKLTATTG